MRQLELNEWPRRSHFEFFRQFDEPFFGVTAVVDCTRAFEVSKENGFSFFLNYLHKASVAANSTEQFRYRIRDEQVIVFDQADLSATISRSDGTFGFSYLTHFDEFETFCREAKNEIARVRESTGLEPAVSGENVIHYSALPWIRFTSLSHARNFSFPDSAPKISFGKMAEVNGIKNMPVSVHVHHALMDGLHVGQFIEEFQRLLLK